MDADRIYTVNEVNALIVGSGSLESGSSTVVHLDVWVTGILDLQGSGLDTLLHFPESERTHPGLVLAFETLEEIRQKQGLDVRGIPQELHQLNGRQVVISGVALRNTLVDPAFPCFLWVHTITRS